MRTLWLKGSSTSTTAKAIGFDLVSAYEVLASKFEGGCGITDRAKSESRSDCRLMFRVGLQPCGALLEASWDPTL